jgi:hypothetical protein
VKLRQLVVTVAVFAIFSTFATWRSPLPGVNEPHYLCKAKHFSDSAWCARDLFLTSANAHWVFYATFGPLTRVLSLEAVAWIGRVFVWAGLALAWVRLAALVVPGARLAICSAAVFVALQATGNLSGEWLLGGFEAKGVAYVALLWGIAAACRHAWREAAVAAGFAVSFHPVVGVWGVAALVAAGVQSGRRTRRSAAFQSAGPPDDTTRPDQPRASKSAWRGAIAPLFFFSACSLPGLIPAVSLLVQAPSRAEQREADEIQVFDRLNHHLDPEQFAKPAWLAYSGLLVGWLVLRCFNVRNDAERFWTWFVFGTLAIATGGLVAGFGLQSAGLLKFYPFRLADLYLPIAFSFTFTGVLERIGAQGLAWHRLGRGLTLTTILAALIWSFRAPGRDDNPARWSQGTWADFVAACRWIEQHTPQEALFLTPRYNVGFKWYGGRAEYVSWKDCPQDARGILEWRTRLDRIKTWRDAHFETGFTAAALRDLQRETGIEYVLASNGDPWQGEPSFSNHVFSVYRIAAADPN